MPCGDPTFWPGHSGQMQRMSKGHDDLRQVIEAWREHSTRSAPRQARRGRDAEGDPERREMEHGRGRASSRRRRKLEQQLKGCIMPKDPNDEKDTSSSR